uniref:Reverse transcriptase domain-containing protein n=1 Tax=Tanacetum cinerariifolium TaxID=118510 RepID=A0A699HE15_TANCI|nr:reverse transcriptase domain-containing protein [Tanacetum cinerariifolium]
MYLWNRGRHVLGLQEKSLPFFKTLKKFTKKSNFQWTAEAEVAFKQMKKLIAELPTLTTPMEKEELIVYLAATREAVSAVLMMEKEEKQMPVYFVSRALQEEELSDPWTLFTNGLSYVDGSKASLILTNLEGAEFTYALRFRFDATNNKAEYEALIAGLRITKNRCEKFQTNVDSRLVANQIFGSKGHTDMILLANNARGCKKIDKGMSRLPGLPPCAKKPTAKTDSHHVPVAILQMGNQHSRTLPEGTWQSQIPNSGNGLLYEKEGSKYQFVKQKSKAKMEKYYNSKVRNTSFKLGDLVYRNNDASHAKDSGKLSPKWKGLYEVTKSLGNRAYKIRECNGKLHSRT